MKLSFSLKFTLLSLFSLGSWSVNLTPAKASQFAETAMNQSMVTAIARPYGEGKYDLLVIEQVPNKKQCWSEGGSNPVLINPLLLNFDFTGHCRRSTDSNGYSVRIDGEDYGLEYLFRLVPRGNELVLVATSRTGKFPELLVGSTNGLAQGFMKVNLYPGWQFTKRTYNGKPLGHFYFSTSQATLQRIPPSNPSSATPTVAPVTPVTPVEPVTPVAPVTPVTPVEPVKPTSSLPEPSPVSETSSTAQTTTSETIESSAVNSSTPPRSTSTKKNSNPLNQFRKPY